MILKTKDLEELKTNTPPPPPVRRGKSGTCKTYSPSSLDSVKPYMGWVTTPTRTPDNGVPSSVFTRPRITDTWLKHTHTHNQQI